MLARGLDALQRGLCVSGFVRLGGPGVFGLRVPEVLESRGFRYRGLACCLPVLHGLVAFDNRRACDTTTRFRGLW